MSASEEASSEDLETETLCGWFRRQLDDFGSVYHVPKKVGIRARALKIPYVIATGVVILFVVGYELLYRLQFMKEVPSLGSVVVSVFPPLSNFWTCSNVDIDCQYRHFDRIEHQYCNPDQTFDGFGDFEGCDFVDSREVSPLKYTQSMFIATSVRRIHQKFNPDFSMNNLSWIASSDKTYFIAGIEDFILQIRHSTDSQACESGCSNFEMQGFVSMKDGMKRFPCHDNDKNIGCAQLAEGSAHWKSMDTCGSCSNAGESDLCSSSEWGDVFSVSKILEAAGVSLDHNTSSGLPKRLVGTSLVMEVFVTNDDIGDFWSWPFGMKFKYEYRFTEMPLDGLSSNRLSKVHYHGEHQQTRLVEQFLGIPILIQHKSRLRVPSLSQAVYAIVISLTAVQVSRLFVEVILTRLYSKLSGFRTTAHMYKHFATEESPHQEEFNDAVENGSFHHLKRLHKDMLHRKVERTIGPEDP